MSALSGKIPAIAAVMICAALCDASVDLVCWNDGEWDDSGAPNGKLLSDNPGWWGRCVFTGVTYSYAKEPANPKDVLQGDKDAFGRRLLDGRTGGDWSVPVGKPGKDPIVVVFDFKRPCSFAEVDVFASRSPEAHIVVETSSDGATWGPVGSCQSTKARTRIKPGACAAGRYLRLSFKASRGVSYLDEVLVWGDGEVSERYPENIKPIQRSGFLRMADGLGGNIRIVPLRDPTACSKTKTGMPPFELRADEASGREIVMARNETETRYFAVVNDTGDTVRLPISATGFGDDVKPEIRIGGVVRTKPPPRKLTAKQLFDLKVTGTEPPDTFGADEFDVLPFFSSDIVPAPNFARKYLANPEQVSGFPDAVEIASGDCAVIMLRLSTSGAAAGRRDGALAAGGARRNVPLRIVDATLPDTPPWVFAWGAFTRQFPFESRSRFVNDARPLKELGVTMFRGMPIKGGKVALASTGRGNAVIWHSVYASARVRAKTCRRDAKALDDEDRRQMRERVAELRRQCAGCGVAPERVVLEISDEPGTGRAAIFGETCRYLREIAPDMSIYMNPCFWTGRCFSPPDEIIDALKGYYGECVDVSVPYRSLVEDEAMRNALWTQPRRVNAQYAHPAHRAGRSLAWSSFRYGLDGFGYWAYYSPTGNPWDIRTWPYWAYECQMVFPLEEGVATTPVYEEMREAYEDWRLLSLLRGKGLRSQLDALLKDFSGSFDPDGMETARPYTCDFAALRLRALEMAVER